jgi:cation diffusion facilitator family transporter
MTNWLIKHFVTDKCGNDERKTRLQCGRLSGIIGIILNIVLGLVKLFVGTVTNSTAITVDAVNNITDAASSVITLIGFSFANRKSDAEHPFGHARFEYMTGVIVSALVIVVGVMSIINAWGEVKNPTPISTSNVVIVLLIIVTLVKIWLYGLNIKLSKFIDSSSLKATGIDSRNDAIISTSTLVVILLFRFAGVNIDGIVGIAVGVFIVYSGLNMVKETASPLLGKSPDAKTVREIADLILSHKDVLGIHDLIVHDYGPGHIFASVHIEVDSREDVFKSHMLVDDIEKKAQEKLQVLLVGHMDPLDTQNPQIKEISDVLKSELEKIDGVIEFHDLRLVPGPTNTTVIFDVVVSHDNSDSTFKKVEKTTQETLSKIDEKYVAVINLDLDYNNK